MAKIEDFKKEYVSTVVFNEGDQILVTKENIEDLRKALKNTNFHWVSGRPLVKHTAFKPGIIITLDENGCTYMDTLLADVRDCKLLKRRLLWHALKILKKDM